MKAIIGLAASLSLALAPASQAQTPEDLYLAAGERMASQAEPAARDRLRAMFLHHAIEIDDLTTIRRLAGQIPDSAKLDDRARADLAVARVRLGGLTVDEALRRVQPSNTDILSAYKQVSGPAVAFFPAQWDPKLGIHVT